MFDGKAFGEEIATMMREHVAREIEKATAPLVARIADLEGRPLPELPQIELPPVPDFEAMFGPTLKALQDGTSDALARVEALEGRPAPEKGEPGQDGASVDMEAVEAMVAKAVEALPKAKDGEPGKDGVGLASALIDRDGALVVTLTDGSAKALGRVVGRDGDPGKDGADGVGFDDLTFEYDGERGFKAVWVRGDVAKESPTFRLPIPIYRGTHALGAEYERGDNVTRDGGTFIALKDTDAQPGASDDWRLMAKRGRDGKDGVVKPK